MKIAVIGSRSVNNYNRVKEILNMYPGISLIVSGGAKGADTLGERYADENNIEKLIFIPDWAKLGNRAGFLRNIDIVKNSEMVIAFWDGSSQGTKHSMKLALEMQIPLLVVQNGLIV